MKWKLFDWEDFTEGWDNKPFLGWIKRLFSSNTLDSLTNKVTGAGLTGAEQEANQFTAQQAQLNRDWQAQMDSTKYQRTVADMRAAGINPALAMSNGAGSTPSGSAGSSVSPGAGFNLGDILQLALLKPQKELIAAQAQQARNLGEAALKNAGTNSRNAASNERNAAVNERNAAVNELLAKNTIRLGDNTIKLSEKQMEAISQDILESQSRVSLQECELACKQLNLQFEREMYDTNKALLIQQIAYRAVEMSHLQQMDKESLQRISYMSAEEAGIAWQKEHPKLAGFIGASSGFTGIIGNVFKGSAGAFVSKVIK